MDHTPAPLARARRFSVPGRTLTAVHLARGRIEEAERAAQTSAERVQVLLAKGDEQSLVRVLDEPSAQGTELAYMVRLKLLQMRKQEPDEMWHDDVSALVGGPSERFAYSLLARVDVNGNGRNLAVTGEKLNHPRLDRLRLGVFQKIQCGLDRHDLGVGA